MFAVTAQWGALNWSCVGLVGAARLAHMRCCCEGYYRYWERAFMDAVVVALLGGVAHLQAIVAGQNTGPVFRVRGF